MIRPVLKSLAAATVAFSALSAHAALTTTGLACSDAILAPAYTSCSGAFDGNNLGNAARLADVQAAITTLAGPGTWTFQGSSNDAITFGPFTSNPTANAGTLTFDSAIDGAFVLSLKAGNAFSLYYFDGSGPAISAIDYTTLGVQVNVRGIGAGLSHASLYTAAVTPVPEPETYALMMAGLGVMGFVARRRRRA